MQVAWSIRPRILASAGLSATFAINTPRRRGPKLVITGNYYSTVTESGDTTQAVQDAADGLKLAPESQGAGVEGTLADAANR